MKDCHVTSTWYHFKPWSGADPGFSVGGGNLQKWVLFGKKTYSKTKEMDPSFFPPPPRSANVGVAERESVIYGHILNRSTLLGGGEGLNLDPPLVKPLDRQGYGSV